MIGFLYACLWLLLTLLQVIAGFVLRVLAGVFWLFWPLILMAALIASAQPCEASWLSWMWGSDTRQLEQSLDVAQQAARVASQASQAQAQQAAAHADQNARLAETLAQLSSERSNLADHLHALTEMGMRDSQLAAAINASGPILVSCAVLLVAGLALWLANKPGDSQHAELAQTVDLLVEEVACNIGEPTGVLHGPLSGSPRLGYRAVHALIGPRYSGLHAADAEYDADADAGVGAHGGDDPEEQDGSPAPF